MMENKTRNDGNIPASSNLIRGAERALSAAYEQLQTVFDNVGSGITAVIMHGEQIEYLFVNDRYYEMLGYTKAQYQAEVANVYDLIHPDDRQKVRKENEDVNIIGKSTTLEYRVIRRDNKQIWIRIVIFTRRFEGVAQPVQFSVLTDITADKEREQEIRALNENLQNMMNDTPGGFARLRVCADGVLSTEYVNEPLCRLRGMTAAEIIAADSIDPMNTIHPDDASYVAAAMRKMIETGEGRNIQYRLRQANGSFIPVNVFTRISKNEAGDIYINVYFIDLSEQQRKDMTLRETIPYVFSAIMQYSTDLVFAKDKEFRYICCSPAFVKFTRQKTEQDVIGKNDYDFWTKEEADHFRGDDMRLFETGEPLVDYIEPIPSDDGIQHYCSTSKYVLRDSTGEIIGMYGIGRDITAQRTALDQLRLLTNSIPGGLATYEISPRGTKITYFNDGFSNILGCTREECANLSSSGIISAVFTEDAPRLQAQLDALLHHDAPLDCTYRVHTKGGGFKWVNNRGNVSERREDVCIVNTVLFDVTETKLAEQAARIHEEEMRLAISQFGKMICEYDPVTHTLTVPEAFATQYDLSATVHDVPDSLIRSGVIDPATVDSYRAFYDAILRGEKTGSAEYRDRSADGNYRWEHIEFSMVYDSDGKPVKAIIAVEDTTQQHLQFELEQNRPSLGEENLLIHALFNLNTGETLDYAYRDGSGVPWEHRTAFTFGGDNLETLLIDAEERERYRALNNPKKLLRLYEKGETKLSIDYRRKMPNGEVIWVRNLLHMVRKPGGSDILLFEYCYNIEDEKTKEQMYATLINESYDYVARINARNHHFSVMTNASVKDEPIPQSGDEADDVAYTIANTSVHPDDREMALKNTLVDGMKQNLEATGRFQFTFRMMENGELHYKRITQYYLDREREIIIIIREDISEFVLDEIKKSEQLEAALNAASEASHAKSEFLSRMSHDMRTPMNAIIGMVLLAQDEDVSPSVKTYLDNINTSSRYLLGLINDVLDLSKIESGRIELNEEPLSAKEFINSVNTVIRPLMEAKQLDFIINLDTSKRPILVDKLRFNQIFFNLLANASKYTPPGGRVEFCGEPIPDRDGKRGVRFFVRDSGVGMSEEFQKIAFEPFSQERTQETKSLQGTGLGLAIVKHIVEAMDGNISIKSALGEGTEFTVDLYVQEADEQQTSGIKHKTDHSRLIGLQVLLVEDNELNVVVAQRLLERKGCIVTVAANGQEALDKFQESPLGFYGAILMDVRMPVMNGLEATQRIRALDRADAATVAIIAMTADAFINDRNKTLAVGMNAHIAKPIEPQSLYDTIVNITGADLFPMI